MSVMQASLRYFKEAGKGRFVNISSGSGIMPEPLMSIYSASKHAVEGFTESVAYELATQNVSVKLIEPGLVKGTSFMQQTQKSSESIPQPSEYKAYVEQVISMYMGRSSEGLATEQDVAEAIFRAATEDSGELRTLVGGRHGKDSSHEMGNFRKRVQILRALNIRAIRGFAVSQASFLNIRRISEFLYVVRWRCSEEALILTSELRRAVIADACACRAYINIF